jgi:2-methylisocitrate lyase-like PEP mutase family enzyme
MGRPCDVALKHIAEIASHADLPVNADFESGYAHDPEGVARNVKHCIDTGVAGLSIEDQTGDRGHPLYNLAIAIDRIKAARAAIDESGTGVLLTARSECYLVGHPEAHSEALRRLVAFSEAGADVLYAPGVVRVDEIRAIVSAVTPKPVNVLMSQNTGLRAADLAELGVRRISVGSALARAAWGAFIRAAGEMARGGSFEGFDTAASFADLNTFFHDDLVARS